jgi:acetyl-CoA carboxylase biotin carboxylase subunit
MFHRILIANRGEIALRVIRTAREMGVECVSVYSDADKSSLHTRMAHVAVPLGDGPPANTYLEVDKILAAAAETGAEAIHPGYGFLAENADFARRVTAAGLTWIGPPPEAIEIMGDKITSRRAMEKAGVPIVPGTKDPLKDPEEALPMAETLGYPVALKASAGGGGKGIRVVAEPAQMESAFRTASGEALGAFGDGRLYMEKYLGHARHIEVQVLFDHHGNGIHLGERECSIQRRHQKLVEECPSVVVDEILRERMGEVALQAGHSVNYQGAGTVEFLHEDGEFYFLEMNTRLQVEHPVTEMVTGVDLVREQLRVAAGEPLGMEQADIQFHGHAIEVRINAEDPANGFLPSTGVLSNLRMPAGPWVRLDSAMYRGLKIGTTYDPMLAKVIVWGPDRERAIARMERALEELNVGGVRTGAPAALSVLRSDGFRKGDFDTHYLDNLDLSAPSKWEGLTAAAAAVYRYKRAHRRSLATTSADRDPWLARSRGEWSDYARRSARREMPGE